ncbi:MAG: hypothetical protein M1819_001678 [Sarea resinae]|nr:MAG: hypothetical protein M1819_001678 [Sarea resinae]
MTTSALNNVETTFASISDEPRAGQAVSHVGKNYTTIKEGLAYILIPESASAVPEKETEKAEGETQQQPQTVFYNPIQQFNRDLSVLAIKAFGEEAVALKRQRREHRGPRKKSKKRKRVDAEGAEDVVAEEQGAARKKTDSGYSEVGENTNGSRNESGLVAAGQENTDAGGTETLQEGSAQPEPTTAEAVNSSTNGQGAAKAWQPPFRILDALSATGLRALRYSKEIPFTTSVTANDLSAAATASIKLNVQHNRVEEKVVPLTGNALAHMYSFVGQPTEHSSDTKKYDVIDLDPYGTAVPFLDASMQCLTDGGLLCVTCTDAGVFASTGYLEKTYALYGGLPMKGPHSHEAGLRLILQSIATTGAKYGFAIEPLLSLSIDFYARVFVRVRRSPADVKFLAGKTMIAYNCDSGCGAWATQLLARNRANTAKNGSTYYKHTVEQAPSAGQHCEHCGHKRHLAGPMYAGPLHSPAFIQRILDSLATADTTTYATTDRIEGMLQTALEEDLSLSSSDTSADQGNGAAEPDAAKIDHHPFFFIPSAISKVIHCQTPSEEAIRGALKHLGYRVSRSHTKPGSIKTDAPWDVIWEIMREWTRQKSPIKEGSIKKGTAGWEIMYSHNDSKSVDKRASDIAAEGPTREQPSENLEQGAPAEAARLNVVFDEKLGKIKAGKRLVRYQLNPRPNWGPMNRAKR